MSEELNYCIATLKKVNHYPYFMDFNPISLRALMNITMPENLPEKFYSAQDHVLQEEMKKKKVISAEDIPFFKGKIALYQGDITCIQADAIVNACNEKLLGCFQPLHSCIDNAIHSAAGLQVRRDLMKVMEEQGYDEPNGQCKVTKGYNLPASYIFHTVGPKAFGRVSHENEEDLKNCYLSCLKKADEMHLKTIVFCSISTGVYGYPLKEAGCLAVKTVTDYLKKENTSLQKVIFDVFSKGDYDVYYRTIEEND